MPQQNNKSDKNSRLSDKDSEEHTTECEKDPFGHTAVYEKDPKTGLWIVKNPSGSVAYNYLYRNNDHK